MSLPNPNTVVTEQRLGAFYQGILPYLGRNSSTLSDLTDVDLNNLQNGQVIKWDTANGKWVNANESGGSGDIEYNILMNQTLLAGNTTVTFSDIPVSGDYFIDFYTSTGINYTSIDTSTAGQVTLIFDVQENDVEIYCEVRAIIPDGSQVIPTDDIPTWFKCANVPNTHGYSTISDVLGDATTLLALINSQNACKYLARSTSWINAVCASQTAMEYIGANNYCSRLLLSKNTWLMGIYDSSYSNEVLNTKIPVMTSNTTPSGEASASGVWQSGYEAYKAFNGDTSQTQGWINNTYTGGWLQYDFGNSVYFYLFDYKGGVNGGYRALKNFKLQGTNNGVDFVDLTDTIINTDSVIHTENPITKNNDTAYRYIRVACDTTETTQAFNGIAVLQVYGRTDV